MSILAPQLELLGLVVREVKGDGNCLFRSCADQLFGTEERGAELRARCCAYLRAHPDDFSPFLLEEEDFRDMDSYVAAMECDGEWAGNVDLQALCASLCLNATVHQAGQRPWMLINSPTGADAPGLHISYHDGSHYNSVRAASDLTVRPAAALRFAGTAYVPACRHVSLADVVHAGGIKLALPYVLVGAVGAVAAEAEEEDEEGMEEASEAAGGAVGSAKIAEQAAGMLTASASTATKATGHALAVAPRERPARNGPCPCGSGRAYRRCCMDADLALERRMASVRVSESAEEAHGGRGRPAAGPAGGHSRGGGGRGKRGKGRPASRDSDSVASVSDGAPIFI